MTFKPIQHRHIRRDHRHAASILLYQAVPKTLAASGNSPPSSNLGLLRAMTWGDAEKGGARLVMHRSRPLIPRRPRPSAISLLHRPKARLACRGRGKKDTVQSTCGLPMQFLSDMKTTMRAQCMSVCLGYRNLKMYRKLSLNTCC